MSPLGLVAAVAVGASLGFFGGGGSILMVPLFVYVFGLEPKTAISSSLLVVAVASATGALSHARARNLRPRTALFFGAAGMAGAYAGGRAGALVDGGILLLLFAFMMVFTALAMWRGRRGSAARAPREVHPVKLALQGLAVGSFTGLVGAGGGFLIVPALVLWAGLPMAQAVGTSLLVIVLNSLAGFAGTLSHASIDPALVGAVAACAVAGSLGGARLGRAVDPAHLRRAFAGLVLGMAAVILVRESSLLLRTAREALPATASQLAFALAMLVIGVLAGRVSRGAGDAEGPQPRLEHGEGI